MSQQKLRGTTGYCKGCAPRHPYAEDHVNELVWGRHLQVAESIPENENLILTEVEAIVRCMSSMQVLSLWVGTTGVPCALVLPVSCLCPR